MASLPLFLCLGFVYGAFSTEVLRAAIQAVPVGQIEAAKAYGMSPFLRFRRIILPAMLPYAIPGMGQSLAQCYQGFGAYLGCGFYGTRVGNKQAAGVSKLYLMFYIFALLVYLSITLISNQVFGWLELCVRRGQPKLA